MKRTFEDNNKNNDQSNQHKRRMDNSFRGLVGNIPCTLHYPLNREDVSWIETFTLPGNYQIHPSTFQMLWEMHPPKRSSFKKGTEEDSFPFWWCQFFGNVDSPIPTIVIPWLNFLNEKTNYTNGFKNPFNTLQIHWFENGEDWTCCSPRMEEEEIIEFGNSMTVCILFGHPRTIHFKKKLPDPSFADLRVTLNHEMVLVVGGFTDTTHLYILPPMKQNINSPVGQSILLTFKILKKQ